MDYYSIWPFFVSIGMILAIAASPAFRSADAPPSPSSRRLPTLDGLRGFLALAVVFHHAAIHRQYLLTGNWNYPPSPFYTTLGQAGVALFFMVTGYLFWSRLVSRGGRAEWAKLYIGRVFRIAPVYLVAFAGLLIFVAAETGPHLGTTPPRLAWQLAKWSALGALGQPDINGYPATGLLLAGVVWSLRYEWLFYAALPVIALAARSRRTHLPFAVAGLGLCAVQATVSDPSHEAAYACLFFAGMTSASLHQMNWRPHLPDWAASLAVLALLATVFTAYDTVYLGAPLLLLGAAFYLIASGCSVFRLLLTRPARRLGDISYGIYILQGLVFAAFLRPAPLRAFFLHSPVQHWALSLACALLIVVFATVAHVLVERPGIELGKWVAIAFASRAQRKQHAVPGL